MPTLIDAEDRFLTFDNVITENYREPADVTAFPIENTATVTDHRQIKQRELNLELLVTETPIAPGGLTELDFGPAALDIPEAPTTIEGPRSSRALAFIRRTAELGTFSYISKRLGLLERLMLVDMEYEVNGRLDLRINLTCVQVEFSESRVVDLPPLAVRRSKPEVCPKVEQGDRGKGGVPEDVFVGPRQPRTATDAFADFAGLRTTEPGSLLDSFKIGGH